MANGIQWQVLRAATSSALSSAGVGTYVNIGTAFTVPIRCLLIDNLTNADLIVSIDFSDVIPNATNPRGTVVAARSGRVIDISTNKLASPKDDGEEQPINIQVAATLIAAAPSPFTGSVYVSAWNAISENYTFLTK